MTGITPFFHAVQPFFRFRIGIGHAAIDQEEIAAGFQHTRHAGDEFLRRTKVMWRVTRVVTSSKLCSGNGKSSAGNK